MWRLHCVLFALGQVVTGLSVNADQESRVLGWIQRATHYIRTLDCETAFFAVYEQCQKARDTPESGINVYLAHAFDGSRKVQAFVPDGNLTPKGENHEAVLVFDPFPNATFGHFVLMFFVDQLSESSCELSARGTYIESTGDCLQLVVKKGCRINLRHSQRPRHYQQAVRCAIDFLPTVFEAPNERAEVNQSATKRQLLQCLPDVPKFAKCFETRSSLVTERQSCSVDKNNFSVRHYCDHKVREALTPRCRLLETCDHAVIVHGGWNQGLSRNDDFEALSNVVNLLANNGFAKANIRTFYTNGILDTEGLTVKNLLPASPKSTVRSVIRAMCKLSRCVDTLAVFLRGPATSRGALLLWDRDKNGMADDTEQYTSDEILQDLSNCQARQLFVVADYSYAGQLMEKLQKSKNHEHAIAMASSGPLGYAPLNFTSTLARKRFENACIQAVFETTRREFSESSAEIFDGSRGYLHTTLAGAPCDVTPPYSQSELSENYFGCQNVPAPYWFNDVAALTGSQSEEPESPDASGETFPEARMSFSRQNRNVRRKDLVKRQLCNLAG